jgi:hypothetical protein
MGKLIISHSYNRSEYNIRAKHRPRLHIDGGAKSQSCSDTHCPYGRFRLWPVLGPNRDKGIKRLAAQIVDFIRTTGAAEGIRTPDPRITNANPTFQCNPSSSR